MNIIECHFEFGGFDDHLVRGGISVYLWNLCRQFRAAGHRVTALTAAHGLLPELRRYRTDGPAPRVRLWPHRHSTDAMFVAAFRRRN